MIYINVSIKFERDMTKIVLVRAVGKNQKFDFCPLSGPPFI